MLISISHQHLRVKYLIYIPDVSFNKFTGTGVNNVDGFCVVVDVDENIVRDGKSESSKSSKSSRLSLSMPSRLSSVRTI